MRVDIEMPIALTATMERDYSLEPKPYPEVVAVRFGDALVVNLTPVRESRAGHGDDSEFFRDEEKSIISDTVAAWLREKLS